MNDDPPGSTTITPIASRKSSQPTEALAVLRALAKGDAKTARQHALALVRPILERPEVRDALAVVRWEPTWQEAAVRLAEAAIVGEHVEKRSGSGSA